MPQVTLPGDRIDKIMARSGDIVGWSHKYAIWRFGFAKGSDAHNAYGVYLVHAFLWVLADHGGNIRESWRGAAVGLPDSFRAVMNQRMIDTVHTPIDVL